MSAPADIHAPAPLPAETVDIVERGVEAIIANALAGLALPSSTCLAMQEAQVERRLEAERRRAGFIVAGEGEV